MPVWILSFICRIIIGWHNLAIFCILRGLNISNFRKYSNCSLHALANLNTQSHRIYQLYFYRRGQILWQVFMPIIQKIFLCKFDMLYIKILPSWSFQQITFAVSEDKLKCSMQTESYIVNFGLVWKLESSGRIWQARIALLYHFCTTVSGI